MPYNGGGKSIKISVNINIGQVWCDSCTCSVYGLGTEASEAAPNEMVRWSVSALLYTKLEPFRCPEPMLKMAIGRPPALAGALDMDMHQMHHYIVDVIVILK